MTGLQDFLYNGQKVDPFNDNSVIKAVNCMRKANDASSIRKLQLYLAKHDQRLRQLQNQEISIKIRNNRSGEQLQRREMMLPKESNESLSYEKIKRMETKLVGSRTVQASPMQLKIRTKIDALKNESLNRTADFGMKHKSTRKIINI